MEQKIEQRINITHASKECTDVVKEITVSFPYGEEGAFVKDYQGIFKGRISALGAQEERERVISTCQFKKYLESVDASSIVWQRSNCCTL
mgnify:CR=1 FL=1